MSNKNSSINIFPKCGISNSKTEEFIFKGHECSVCHGRKEFTEQTGHDEFETTPCPLCEGTGKLKAKVIIAWSPDNETIIQ